MILHYRMRRSEIWRWYWTRWRSSLWKSWLLAGAVAFGVAMLLLHGNERTPNPSDLLIALCAPFIVWVFFALFPQVMFKSEERQLEISSGGIDTEIRGEHAHRDWREIASITEMDGVIALIVARTGNAFLVPDRAFESIQQREAFLRQAREWRAAAGSST